VEFASPVLTSWGIKAQRGFTGEAYAARPETFVVGIMAALEAVAIKGGQETPVAERQRHQHHSHFDRGFGWKCRREADHPGRHH